MFHHGVDVSNGNNQVVRGRSNSHQNAPLFCMRLVCAWTASDAMRPGLRSCSTLHGRRVTPPSLKGFRRCWMCHPTRLVTVPWLLPLRAGLNLLLELLVKGVQGPVVLRGPVQRLLKVPST